MLQGNEAELEKLTLDSLNLKATIEAIDNFIIDLENSKPSRREGYYTHITFSLHHKVDPIELLTALRAPPSMAKVAAKGANDFPQIMDRFLMKMAESSRFDLPEAGLVTVVLVAMERGGKKGAAYAQFKVPENYWKINPPMTRIKFDLRLPRLQKWDLSSLETWKEALNKEMHVLEEKSQELIQKILIQSQGSSEIIRGSSALESVVYDLLHERFNVGFMLNKKGANDPQFCLGCVREMIGKYARDEDITMTAPASQPRFNVICGSLLHDSEETCTLEEVLSMIHKIKSEKGREMMEINRIFFRLNEDASLPKFIALKIDPAVSDFTFSSF